MRLAELNVGYATYPLDDPRMSGFIDNLDTINALAERSLGFVWRMKSDSGNATDISVPGDAEIISNMSVWEDVASLGNYVFNTVHARFYERKEEWFQAMTSHHFVMWMVEDNHTLTWLRQWSAWNIFKNTGRQTTPLAGTSSIKALGGAAQ